LGIEAVSLSRVFALLLTTTKETQFLIEFLECGHMFTSSSDYQFFQILHV